MKGFVKKYKWPLLLSVVIWIVLCAVFLPWPETAEGQSIPARAYWVDTGALKRINLDGTSETTLVSSGITAGPTVTENRIFYGQGNGIRSMNLNGSGIQTVINPARNETISELEHWGSKLYWISNGNSIRRSNYDGSSVETLCSPAGNTEGVRDQISRLVVTGSYLYYYYYHPTNSNVTKVYRTSLNCVGNPLRLPNVEGAYTASGSFIYYYREGTSSTEGIWRTSLTGSSPTRVVRTNDHIFTGIAHYNDRFYWTHNGNDTSRFGTPIYSADLSSIGDTYPPLVDAQNPTHLAQGSTTDTYGGLEVVPPPGSHTISAVRASDVTAISATLEVDVTNPVNSTTVFVRFAKTTSDNTPPATYNRLTIPLNAATGNAEFSLDLLEPGYQYAVQVSLNPDYSSPTIFYFRTVLFTAEFSDISASTATMTVQTNPALGNTVYARYRQSSVGRNQMCFPSDGTSYTDSFPITLDSFGEGTLNLTGLQPISCYTVQVSLSSDYSSSELFAFGLTHLSYSASTISDTTADITVHLGTSGLGNPTYIAYGPTATANTPPDSYPSRSSNLAAGVTTIRGDVTTTLTGLTANTQYALKINNFLPVFYFTTAAAGAPTGFTAVAGNAQIVLSWDNPGNSAITGYQYRINSDGSDTGNWVNISGSSATTITHTITSLTNGQAYYVQTRALVSGGHGGATAFVSATPLPPPPARPTNLAGTTGPGAGEATFTWDNPGNASITKYQYCVDPTGGSGCRVWTDIPGSGATTTSFVLTGYIQNYPLYFRLRAVAGTVIGSSTAYVETLPGPAAPPSSAPSVAVLWNDNVATIGWGIIRGASTYDLRYRITGTTTYTTITGITATSHDLTLAYDTSYDFGVRATNAAGSTDYTGETSKSGIQPPAYVPPNVVVLVDRNVFTVGWDPVPRATTYDLRYRVVGAPSYTEIANLGVNSYSLTLAYNTNYEFAIRANNAGGATLFSSDAAQSSGPPPPSGSPEGLVILWAGNVASVGWDAVSGATAYDLRYRERGTSVYTTQADLTTNSASATLDYGTAYEFSVRAKNTGGVSLYSTNVVTTSPIEAPEVPSTPAATWERNAVTITWTAVTGATSYDVRWRLTGSGAAGWAEVTDISGTNHRLFLNYDTS